MSLFLPKFTAVVITAAVLGGCAGPSLYPTASTYPQPYPQPVQTYPQPVQTYPAAPSYGYAIGTVDSIQMVQGGAPNNGVNMGTVVGGVVGGLLGNQVGGGSGKKVATVAGVVGGAMVGNQMERNMQSANAYQVGVRLDNGGYQTIVQDNVSDLRIGSRVRIANNRVVRY